MKLIFLDFDGVLNTPRTWGTLEKDKCELISKLIAESSVKVVISSSWRSNDVPITIENITAGKDYSDSPLRWLSDVIGVTPMPGISEVISSETDLTPPFWYDSRGGEITHYLEIHPDIAAQLENYVILDDMEDDWSEDQLKHLVKIDPKIGLQISDIEKAIDMLK